MCYYVTFIQEKLVKRKLYVGNLPFKATVDELKGLFQTIGTVTSAKIIYDKESGRSKGFGFIEMENPEDAKRALDELNGNDSLGRNLKLMEAKQDSPQ